MTARLVPDQRPVDDPTRERDECWVYDEGKRGALLADLLAVYRLARRQALRSLQTAMIEAAGEREEEAAIADVRIVRHLAAAMEIWSRGMVANGNL